MDRIAIEGLRVATRVGVSEEERSVPQIVTIDVFITADLRSAGERDDLEETIDYAAVVDRIVQVVASSEARLLENLADRIAAEVAAFVRVRGVRVDVKKEDPPIDHDVRSVGVSIERPG